MANKVLESTSLIYSSQSSCIFLGYACHNLRNSSLCSEDLVKMRNQETQGKTLKSDIR